MDSLSGVFIPYLSSGEKRGVSNAVLNHRVTAMNPLPFRTNTNKLNLFFDFVCVDVLELSR